MKADNTGMDTLLAAVYGRQPWWRRLFARRVNPAVVREMACAYFIANCNAAVNRGATQGPCRVCTDTRHCPLRGVMNADPNT